MLHFSFNSGFLDEDLEPFLFFVIIAMSFFMIMGKMVMIQARPCLALLIYPPVS